MSELDKRAATELHSGEDGKGKRSAAKSAAATSYGPDVVYDPYALIDPFDKEAVRRQKRLRRAALRGEIPVYRGSEGSALRREEACPQASRRDGVSDATADATRESSKETPSPPTADANTVPVRARRRTKRRALAIVASVLIIALMCVGGFALYDYLRPPDFSSYADMGISISGIEEADFIVTPQELSELECVEVSATGQGRGPQGESRVGTVTAYGPTLNTFLADYGLSQTDFSRIIVECKDGYTVVLARDALESEVIMTLSLSKNELATNQQPMRLVIPDEASGQWAYGVLRIEFER